MAMREKLRNTYSVSHNFHNVNWENRKDIPLGYSIYHLFPVGKDNAPELIQPSVREAFQVYIDFLKQQVALLEFNLTTNLPELTQDIVGQSDDWYKYEDGPNGEKNNRRFSETIDLPSEPNAQLTDIFHPHYVYTIVAPMSDKEMADFVKRHNLKIEEENMIKMTIGDLVKVPGHSLCVLMGTDSDSEQGEGFWVAWAEEDEASCDWYPFSKVTLLAKASYNERDLEENYINLEDGRIEDYE